MDSSSPESQKPAGIPQSGPAGGGYRIPGISFSIRRWVSPDASDVDLLHSFWQFDLIVCITFTTTSNQKFMGHLEAHSVPGTKQWQIVSKISGCASIS
jgi:hypothetical protein